MEYGYLKQAMAAFAASLSIFIAGAWLTWPSVALYKWETKEYVLSFELNEYETSWIVAAMDLGNILSPIPSGFIMDSLGRKNTLLLTSIIFILSSTFVIWSQSVWWLIASRFLSGIGKGIGFTVVPMYIAEITDKRIRGTLSTMFTGHLYGGILFSLCLGPYIQYHTLNVALLIIPIIFCMTFCFVPETPYFHILSSNNQKAAKNSLKWFKGKNTNIDDELNEIIRTTIENLNSQKGYRELFFNTVYRKALIIVLITSFLQRLSGISTILSYASTTLPEHKGFIGRSECLIIFSVLLVVSNFACSPLIDILGRRILNMTSALACSLVMMCMAACFYWDLDYWTSYLFTDLFGVTYSLGIGVIPTTLLSELFPTNVKSSAASIAAISFAVASFSINKFYKIIKLHYGLHYIFLYYSICSIIHFMYTWLFVFETKGKSFAEIQDIIRKDIPNTDRPSAQRATTQMTRSGDFIMECMPDDQH